MPNFSVLKTTELCALAAGDLASEQQVNDWIWQGYVARGNTTLFTGIWKGGKTSLLALMLARRTNGGTLAGLAVHPGKTLVITEENIALWNQRIKRLSIDGAWFLPRPFKSIPSPEQWHALIDMVLKFRDDKGIDLLIIDPLAHFLPSENNSKLVLDSLLPLSELTHNGVGVLVTHHPARAERTPGNSARGSGAILSHADISMEMRIPGFDPRTRRRRVIAFSRYDETPRYLLLELNADATDYVVLPDEPDEGLDANWHIIQLILEQAPDPLTRQQVHANWPNDLQRPSMNTLHRWLQSALTRDLVTCQGAGRRTDPFRYALAEDADNEEE